MMIEFVGFVGGVGDEVYLFGVSRLYGFGGALVGFMERVMVGFIVGFVFSWVIWRT